MPANASAACATSSPVDVESPTAPADPLEFEIDSDEARENSLHKLDTLVVAVRLFREGIVAEFEPYDDRERSRKSEAVAA